MNPEKKPPVAAGWHGLLKSPMTTLWLMAWKWNSSKSPFAAVTLLGVKARPFWPTSIRTVVAVTEAAMAMEVRNFMLDDAAVWGGR